MSISIEMVAMSCFDGESVFGIGAGRKVRAAVIPNSPYQKDRVSAGYGRWFDAAKALAGDIPLTIDGRANA